MRVVDQTAQATLETGVLGGSNAPRTSAFDDPFNQNDEATRFESLVNSAVRENSLLSLSTNVLEGSRGVSREEWQHGTSESFNPYTYFREQYMENGDEIDDLLPYIHDGEIDNLQSARQVDLVLRDLRRELQVSRKAAHNPGAAIVGGLLGAVADPTSYIPYVGQAGRIGTASRIGNAALNASLSAGVSEIALQATQRTRTLEETILNIGTAGVIGGGIGYFAPATFRSHPMHKDHPDNPLKAENLDKQGEIVRNSQGTDHLTPDELARLQDDLDSVGAARVDGTQELSVRDTELLRSEPTTKLGRATRKIGDFFNTRTILGRAVRASSPSARRLGLSLMDPGGILIKANAKGIAAKPPAEALKAFEMTRVEDLFAHIKRSMVKLKMDGVSIQNPNAWEKFQKLDERDVWQMIQREVTGVRDTDLEQTLVGRYGQEGFDKIQSVAKENAEEIHRLNADDEARLLDEGILQDEAKVAQLSSELEQAKSEVARLKEAGDEEGLTRARQIRDQARKALRDETRKAKPMGRDYGHAQLWNQDVILEAPDEFRAFLRDALALKPDTDWLAEPPYELTLDEFTALRETDRPRYDAILEDWAGDAWYHRLNQAEDAHAAAKKAEKEAQLDLQDLARSLGIMERKEVSLTLSEARKRRDALMSRMEARRGQDGPEAKRLRERAERFNETLEAVTRRVEETKAAKKQLDDQLSAAREARGLKSKDLRKAKRELLGARKATPLDAMIDDIFENLTGAGRVPQGILDRISRESDKTTGRVKDRIIQLTPDQRMDGIKAGYLRDDLPQVLFNQYDQLNAELALRESLDIGPTRKYNSWGDRIREIEQEYDQMIAETSDRSARDRLHSEKRIIVDDMIEARDRIRGQVMRDDGTSHGWANWLSSKVRAWQFARFGGGFLISSMTDMATYSMRHGSFHKAVWQYGRKAAASAVNLSSKNGVPRNELEAFVASQEIGLGAAAHARRFGSDDLVNGPYGSHGIGNGRTRAITGRIDQGIGLLNETVSLVSGLPLWNRWIKVMAGHQMSVRLRDTIPRFDLLTDIEKADLASVGIGKSEASRLSKLIEKFGETDVGGHFDPGLERWPLEDRRTFLLAIQRDMNRSINTPGVGDTPRLMSHWAGKLWLQFQTFAFTFINRYTYPTSQRVAQGDRQSIASLVWLMGSATSVMVFKDVLNGRDPTERFKSENTINTLHEVIDRSGLLGWTSPYLDASMKVSGVSGAGRYARTNALGSVIGVNYSLPADASQALTAAFDQDPKAVDKLLALAPFSTQARLLQRLAE